MKILPLVILMIVLALVLLPAVASAEEPSWPQDPTQPQALFDRDGPDGEQGYWLWNAYRFVQVEEAFYMWSPEWHWAGILDVVPVSGLETAAIAHTPLIANSR